MIYSYHMLRTQGSWAKWRFKGQPSITTETQSRAGAWGLGPGSLVTSPAGRAVSATRAACGALDPGTGWQVSTGRPGWCPARGRAQRAHPIPLGPGGRGRGRVWVPCPTGDLAGSLRGEGEPHPAGPCALHFQRGVQPSLQGAPGSQGPGTGPRDPGEAQTSRGRELSAVTP